MGKHGIVWTLLLAALLWTSAVLAADDKGERKHRGDHDKGEWREKAAEKEPDLDLDKDGRIDHGELRKAIDEEIGAVDSDKDGKIDHGEQKTALKALKAKVDADKDGKVDHGELKAAFAELKEKHPVIYHRLAARIREHRLKHDGERRKND
jgi:Ca2+-binding EF-hand superfamily protein